MENLGEKIYKLRKLSGKSQEELGFDLGVTRQTISKWESDSMLPSIENLKSLSLILGVSVEFFLSEDSSIEVQIIANEEVLKNSTIASEKEEVAVAFDKKTKITKFLLAFGMCLNSLAFLISLFFTVMLGFIVFTDNMGYRTIFSGDLDIGIFVILLVLTVAFLVGEVLLLMKIIRRKCKSNV